MSKLTSNFSLVKPEKTDPADITAMNNNWDVIDDTLAQLGDLTSNMTNYYTATLVE